jgi:methylated-DNA-[protein]-cysteine S-methyltransferase
MGDWQKAPSGQNQTKKLKLLKEEGVEFDSKGMLRDSRKLFDEFEV